MTTDTFQIQHPRQTDLERVYAFMLQCDMDDTGEADSDRSELADQWAEADPARHAWIALRPDGRLAGYAFLSAEREHGRVLDLYTLRTDADVRLSRALIEHALPLAGTSPGKVTAYTTRDHVSSQQALLARGFTVTKYHFRMQIDLRGEYPAPDWPPRYHRESSREQALPELHAMITAAFQERGLRTSSFEEWRHAVLRDGKIDPRYFLLVRDSRGRLVGAVLAFDDGPRGWIRQLAVSTEDQRRGLGTLLLQQTFSAFARAGKASVCLGVVAHNEQAVRFYEHNGMHRSREFIEYQLHGETPPPGSAGV